MKSEIQTTPSVLSNHADIISSLGWNHIHTIELPAREGRWVTCGSLELSPAAERIASVHPRGLYEHQAIAIGHLRNGHDTALTTATASGKSLVFHAAAAEILSHDSSARILVLYPLRALAEEQCARWTMALKIAGIESKPLLLIGDGLAPSERARAIAGARVVVATPDVIHAWLMSNREKEVAVRKFLQKLKLVAIDEAHAYSAVFGSQAAFLFRRLDHAVRKLGGRFQVAAASATMADAAHHLAALTGRTFEIVTGDQDSAPVHPKRVHFVQPTGRTDLISGLGQWFRHCADIRNGRFLAFVESRVQAEHFARSAGRQIADDEPGKSTEAAESIEASVETAAGGAVRAYRSGFDRVYRSELVDQLREGQIAGLVSTSALELGMDLPDLSVGFIIGAPRSATSFLQRLGRFGRHGEADIFIVGDGSTASAELFNNPESVLNLPLQRSTLYLDNPRIQYIHVLCQAYEERWHEVDNPPAEFTSEVSFPKGFLDLCARELRGESVGDLRLLRPAGDEAPHLTYPLRDCDLQFVVKVGRGHFIQKLGTLTFAQVLREAYPGAAYWHAGYCYRVRSVQVTRRMVLVEKCRATFTRPHALPSVIQPDLSSEAVLNWRTHGNTTVVETSVRARECVNGFHERRGSAEREVAYPLPESDPSGVSYSNDRFCRHIESTGVLLSHPALSDEAVRISEISAAIEEAFLRVVPIERQDIAAGSGRIRADRNGLIRSDRFVALYDRTYGSLRLSGHLADENSLRAALRRAVALGEAGLISDSVTLAALRALAQDTESAGRDVTDVSPGANEPANNSSSPLLTVIRPGSRGVHQASGAVFIIEAVFFAPDGLRYRGRFDHQHPADPVGHLPAAHIAELTGESELAQFDPLTGQMLN
jgi:DEAD/DEAH box helicase domain-containing protein